MNRVQFLLLKLAEECCEVGQRCSKMMQFGALDKEPGQDFTNIERLVQEICDIRGAIELLEDERVLPQLDFGEENAAIEAKKKKILHYLEYSITLGHVKNE